MTKLGLAAKVVRIDRAFARAKIPHAFGGAIALAYYATPRATIDIDVNVFVSPERYPAVAAVLRRLGVGNIPDESIALDRGQVRAWWDSTPIDLFFAYDEIHEEMRSAARSVPFGDVLIPILSPEHLLVAKAAFNRPKDWLDIEQMLVAVDDLDIGEVRRWLVRLVGETDERTLRVERLVVELRGTR